MLRLDLFCSEENVWYLCKAFRENDASNCGRCFAVFISNQEKCVSMFRKERDIYCMADSNAEHEGDQNMSNC